MISYAINAFFWLYVIFNRRYIFVGSNPVLGDVMVLGSAVLYGISNVSMEYISKKHESGNFEILGMFGLFSPFICGIQM